MKLAILGNGFLAGIMVEALQKGMLPAYELVGILGRSEEKTRSLAEKAGCTACFTIGELLAKKPDIVAEAASVAAVKDYAEQVELWMDYKMKEVDWRIAYNEWDVVSDILYGYYALGASSIAADIQAKEEQIAQKKAEIEDISNIQTKEQTIEFIKGCLDIMIQGIEIQEINVQNAKADLEAAMAKYAATEE